MKLSKDEVARYIEDFLNGTGGQWDWDDFISEPIDDPDLDKIRILTADLQDRFPAARPGHFCSEQGMAELRQILRTLRSTDAPLSPGAPDHLDVNRFPDHEIRVSSPAQLRAVLVQAKHCVANGTLRQIRLPEVRFATDDLSAIPDDGPWPDYLEVYFEDRNGTRYRLAVETYHGAGGSWSRA